MNYYGLAIGGPLDGQYVTSQSNVLRIPNPHGEVLLLPDGSRAGHQPHLFHTYIFVTRYWWPYENGKPIPGLTTVLEHLERSYHSVRQAAAAEVPHDFAKI